MAGTSLDKPDHDQVGTPGVLPLFPSVQAVAVNKLLRWTLAMIALAFGDEARAADSLTTSWATRGTEAPSSAPADAPALGSGWTGFYVGAHAGEIGRASCRERVYVLV